MIERGYEPAGPDRLGLAGPRCRCFKRTGLFELGSNRESHLAFQARQECNLASSASVGGAFFVFNIFSLMRISPSRIMQPDLSSEQGGGTPPKSAGLASAPERCFECQVSRSPCQGNGYHIARLGADVLDAAILRRLARPSVAVLT